MSTRYEGCADVSSYIDLYPAGTTIGEYVAEVPTIVVSYDEVFYIEVLNPKRTAQDLRDIADALHPIGAR